MSSNNGFLYFSHYPKFTSGPLLTLHTFNCEKMRQQQHVVMVLAIIQSYTSFVTLFHIVRQTLNFKELT